MRRISRVALAVSAMSLAAFASARASGTPMIVLYASPQTNNVISQGWFRDHLVVEGRVFVQEPNGGHLLAYTDDRAARLSGLSGQDLIDERTAEAMADRLKRRVDEPGCLFPPYGDAECASHLVFIDELDHRFAEPAPNIDTPAWRLPRPGQPRRAFPAYVPKPKIGQPGFELGKAMKILAATPYPGGGTYASRIHFYVAPGVVSSLGVGRGRYQNLGEDGRPHYRSYEGVRPALRLAGGLWLEMYHFDRSKSRLYPFDTDEWRQYPWNVARHVTAPGAASPSRVVTSRVHFLMTRGMPVFKPGAPATCHNKLKPQRCQFALAATTRNKRFLKNGVGQFRMDSDNGYEWQLHVAKLFLQP